jgi:phage baseplate assembly protein gpV
MRVVRILSLAGLVAIFGLVLYLGWERHGPNQTEVTFSAGGKIVVDLSAGDYTVRGTTENKIWLEIASNETQSVHCEMNVSGNHAKVRVNGPSTNFHATIYVPQRSDLEIEQTIGDLRIEDVEGNKQLGLNVGQMQIHVPSTTPLPSFDGSITIGDLRADSWHVEKGGFFRDFSMHTSAPYFIKAHVDIGDLEVSDFGIGKAESKTDQPGNANEHLPQ